MPEWSYQLPNLIGEIIDQEKNDIFMRMINESVGLGRSDKEVIMDLPISESSYYRYKRKFEEKLYDIYIYTGNVSRQEILDAKIMEIDSK